MEDSILLIVTLFLVFILTGFCIIVGVYNVLRRNKKGAWWSFVSGAVFVAIYLIVMFSINLLE